MDVELKSPTGDEIQGTYELVPGSSYVTFGDGEPGFEHCGDTKMHWDGSITQTIDGVALFTDDSGIDWLRHHLIPESAQGLSIETIDTFNAELRIGATLEAARSLQSKLASITAHGDARCVISFNVDATVAILAAEYAHAKQCSVQARAAELAAQPAADE